MSKVRHHVAIIHGSLCQLCFAPSQLLLAAWSWKCRHGCFEHSRAAPMAGLLASVSAMLEAIMHSPAAACRQRLRC